MKNQLIVVIVNSGFSDEVMMAAREITATGGTVISARGTAKKEAEELFGITINPEKDMVLLLVNEDKKDAILHNIYQKVGLNSPSQGIAFTLEVDEVAGLDFKWK